MRYTETYRIEKKDIDDVLKLVDIAKNCEDPKILASELIVAMSEVFKTDRIHFCFSDKYQKKIDISNYVNIGIEEQEQNGVTAPNKEANRFPKAFFLASQPFILYWGKKVLKKPIIEIITKSNNKIFTES